MKGYMTDKPITYADLERLRGDLDRRQSELMKQIEDVSRKLESVTTTIALLRGQELPLSHKLGLSTASHANVSSPQITAIPKSQFYGGGAIYEFGGKTQLQALIHIAEQNNGVVEAGKAKRLLLTAGLIKNPKNAANIIFNVINRSEKFKRRSPGIYELIGYQNKSESPLDHIFDNFKLAAK